MNQGCEGFAKGIKLAGNFMCYIDPTNALRSHSDPVVGYRTERELNEKVETNGIETHLGIYLRMVFLLQ